MKAWVIHKVCDLSKENQPLKMVETEIPSPGKGELLLKVKACGICHTELDEIEGRTPPHKYPVIPGHQVVGIVEQHNGRNEGIKKGDRLGVAWIFHTCGKCEYCLSGRENLCKDFVATGRDVNGGYAEYMVVPEDFVYPIPSVFSDIEAAPLLCAGAVGFRSLELCDHKDGGKIGFTGFGASAHLVLKAAQYLYPHSDTYVFARSENERNFALELGCQWTGDTQEKPSALLDCVIDTTPVWVPDVKALEFLKPGGRLVINAIRKEDIDKNELLNLDYSTHLWLEKEIKSVANVTRADVFKYLDIASKMDFRPEVKAYPFEQANEALIEIKQRKIKGAKVLVMDY